MRFLGVLGLCLSLAVAIVPANAAKFTIDDDTTVVGEMQTVLSRKGDNLARLAIRYGVGYNEIRRANPKLSRKRLRTGTSVVIPTAYRLPDVPHVGLVVNVAEMRLYYFPDNNTVVTYPIAVGKSGWSTPRGITSIVHKRKHPTWTPPPSIIREAARRGQTLRKVYPAGPNNPLGTRALRLGFSGILIHGTNKPWSIGQRRSHGCIRMRRHDVEDLFEYVSVGTPVNVISRRMKPVDYADIVVEETKTVFDNSLEQARQRVFWQKDYQMSAADRSANVSTEFDGQSSVAARRSSKTKRHRNAVAEQPGSHRIYLQKNARTGTSKPATQVTRQDVSRMLQHSIKADVNQGGTLPYLPKVE
ncbi:MAG: hypothetical protein CSA45_04085 [Gammaproteobacteria bacterium]|nr:MAG: hypothetical protein CSA45_04085 [Gammaproteobacteria bacterium]